MKLEPASDRLLKASAITDTEPLSSQMCIRDSLESDIYQHLEELQLLIQAHGLNQSLIAIS